MKQLMHVALALVLMPVAARGRDQAHPTSEKYVEIVRITHWAWKEERASILDSLSQASSRYDIVITRPHDKPRRLKFKIMRGEREVYTWWGHIHSVFSLKGDRLYYVNFVVEAPGGKVVAVDLNAGKELWQSALRGVGDPPHSFYSNLVNIAVQANGDTVSVFGNESGSRYFEVKDARTGETVGHKVFEAQADKQR